MGPPGRDLPQKVERWGRAVQPWLVAVGVLLAAYAFAAIAVAVVDELRAQRTLAQQRQQTIVDLRDTVRDLQRESHRQSVQMRQQERRMARQTEDLHRLIGQVRELGADPVVEGDGGGGSRGPEGTQRPSEGGRPSDGPSPSPEEPPSRLVGCVRLLGLELCI